MRRRIFLILGIVVLVLVVFFAWRFSSRISGNQPPVNPGEAGIRSPDESDRQISIESDVPVLGYWFYNNVIYSIDKSGHIYGDGKLISSQDVFNISGVIPSSDGSRAIIVSGREGQGTFLVFNTATEAWETPLPKGVSAAAWAPHDSNQNIYLREGREKSALVLTARDTGETETIIEIAQKDLNIEWVRSDSIYLSEEPSVNVLGSLWRYNLEDEVIEIVARDERGLIVKWLDDTKGLKFSDNQLTIINHRGQELATLDIVTLPSKCAFDDVQSTLYCGVPSNVTRGVLPDEYLKRALVTEDNIYIIPLTVIERGLAGLLESFVLVSPPRPLDASQLQTKNNRLYFVNRIDDRLYSIEL